MERKTITIVQNNTLHWSTNKHNLTNTYLRLNPDILLLNSHGFKDSDNIKITGYNTYNRNTTNAISDGSAILIKKK